MTEKTVYIRFFALVNADTVNKLMLVVQQKLSEGVRRFVLLISSPGGDVQSGLSAYNFLKGIPAEIITHNFGSADSIGSVLYCAGSKRFSVPHARFLLHGVSLPFSAGMTLEEKQLEERLKSLKIDMENIAKVIAANVKKSDEEVKRDMLDRTTLNPEQAIKYGLVHEIKSELVELGAEIISI
jgi:ATP-dependent protease ClpP protease subunit